MNILNNYGMFVGMQCCFGGKPPQPPEVQAPPTPAPPPTIMPSSVSPQSAGEARRKQIEKLRYGLASTIKTSPMGVTGSGANLSPTQQGKTKLG